MDDTLAAYQCSVRCLHPFTGQDPCLRNAAHSGLGPPVLVNNKEEPHRRIHRLTNAKTFLIKTLLKVILDHVKLTVKTQPELPPSAVSLAVIFISL